MTLQLLIKMSDDQTRSEFDPDRTRSKSSEDLRKSRIVGPYKLLQQIAEGGMGGVWMVEQEKPVRRQVVLKLIRAGQDNKKILARFETDRQALAMMDHKNIAKVFDAGTTEQGQPYFVMELVQGMTLTQCFDQHKLSIDERLKLFIPICKSGCPRSLGQGGRYFRGVTDRPLTMLAYSICCPLEITIREERLPNE